MANWRTYLPQAGSGPSEAEQQRLAIAQAEFAAKLQKQSQVEALRERLKQVGLHQLVIGQNPDGTPITRSVLGEDAAATFGDAAALGVDTAAMRSVFDQQIKAQTPEFKTERGVNYDARFGLPTAYTPESPGSGLTLIPDANVPGGYRTAELPGFNAANFRRKGAEEASKGPNQVVVPAGGVVREFGQGVLPDEYRQPGGQPAVPNPPAAPTGDVFSALIEQESGGRAGVLGPQTRYGRAEGMTQMLPATAKEMANKLGLPWRPELMRGTSEQAATYQQTLGRAYFDEGLQKYGGDTRRALMYYHGGPDERLWGPKTRSYADQVLDRVGLAGGQGSDDLPGDAGADQLGDPYGYAGRNGRVVASNPFPQAQRFGNVEPGTAVDIDPRTGERRVVQAPQRRARPPTAQEQQTYGITPQTHVIGPDGAPVAIARPAAAGRNKYQDVLDAARAKKDVEKLTGASDAVTAATDIRATADRAAELLNSGRTPTGPAADARIGLGKAVGGALGWLPGVPTPRETANLEEIRRLGSEGALASVAKLKGPLSEKELGFLQRLQIDPDASVKANKRTAQFQQWTAKRALAYEQSLQDWTARWGSPSAKDRQGVSFDRRWSDWSRQAIPMPGSAKRPNVPYQGPPKGTPMKGKVLRYNPQTGRIE